MGDQSVVLPTKDFDRQKPFKRINNDVFKPQAKPDGDGVKCGCHTPKDLPSDDELRKQFHQFIANSGGVLGKVLSALDAVKPIVDGLDSVLKGLDSVLSGIPIIGTVLKTILKPVTFIAELVDTIAKTVDDVLREFLDDIGLKLMQRGTRYVPQWVPVKVGAKKDTVVIDQVVEVEGLALRSYAEPVAVPFSQWHTWFSWSVQVVPEDGYENLISTDIVPGPDLTRTVSRVPGKEQPVPKSGTFDIQWDMGALNGFPDGSAYETGFKQSDITNASSITDQKDGPMTFRNNNWIWPTTGMYVWASGRHVYDCSRVDSFTDANPKTCAMMNPPRALATARWGGVQFDENNQNPDGSTDIRSAVPAIQFMFVACHRGGYIDYEPHQAPATTYEFILDLPPLDLDLKPFPIAFTPMDGDPTFDHNAIVLRPRLLQKVEGLLGGNVSTITPNVQVLPPSDPTKAPTQVLVTISADQLKVIETRPTPVVEPGQIIPTPDGPGPAAGFILSLGWHDPERLRAATVKNVNVTLQRLDSFLNRDNSVAEFDEHFKALEDRLTQKVLDKVDDIEILGVKLKDFPTPEDHKGHEGLPSFVYELSKTIKDKAHEAIKAGLEKFRDLLAAAMGTVESDEWLFHIGVNGNWRAHYIGDMDPGDDPFNRKDRGHENFDFVWQLFLGPEDGLFVSSSGPEINALGGMMCSALKDRALTVEFLTIGKTTPLSWADIVSASDSTTPAFKDVVFAYAIQTFKGNDSRALALGSENTELGLLDPDLKAGTTVGTSNPLIVKDITTARNETISLQATAKFARTADPDYAVMEKVEMNDDTKDYTVKYVMTVTDVVPKKPPPSS